MHRFGIALAFVLTITAASAGNDLAGLVVDASSTPVAGAHVYVFTALPKIGVSAVCPSCYRDCGQHEPVDAKGAFRLKALDQTLLFNASRCRQRVMSWLCDSYWTGSSAFQQPRAASVRAAVSAPPGCTRAVGGAV
jgi:hypothetical protein